MLKMRALTEQLYVDEVDMDEEGIAETLMDSNAIANVPRPGTSLKQPSTGTNTISRGVRCEHITPVLLVHSNIFQLF